MAINYVKLTRIEKRTLFNFAKTIPKDPSQVCPVVLMNNIEQFAEKYEDDRRYSELFHKILFEMVNIIRHIVNNPRSKVWKSLSDCIVKTEEARMAKKIIKICMFEPNSANEEEKNNVIPFPNNRVQGMDSDEEMEEVSEVA